MNRSKNRKKSCMYKYSSLQFLMLQFNPLFTVTKIISTTVPKESINPFGIIKSIAYNWKISQYSPRALCSSYKLCLK